MCTVGNSSTSCTTCISTLFLTSSHTCVAANLCPSLKVGINYQILKYINIIFLKNKNKGVLS